MTSWKFILFLSLYVLPLFGMKYKYDGEKYGVCETCDEKKKLLYEIDDLKMCSRCTIFHLSNDFDKTKMNTLKFLATDIIFERCQETSFKGISFKDVKKILLELWTSMNMEKRYEDQTKISYLDVVNRMIPTLEAQPFESPICQFCFKKHTSTERSLCCKRSICFPCINRLMLTHGKCKKCKYDLCKNMDKLEKMLFLCAYGEIVYVDQIIPTPEVKNKIKLLIKKVIMKSKKHPQELTVSNLTKKVGEDVRKYVKTITPTPENSIINLKNMERLLSDCGLHEVLSGCGLHELLAGCMYFKILMYFEHFDPTSDILWIAFNTMGPTAFAHVIWPLENLEKKQKISIKKSDYLLRDMLKCILMHLNFLILLAFQYFGEDTVFWRIVSFYFLAFILHVFAPFQFQTY